MNEQRTLAAVRSKHLAALINEAGIDAEVAATAQTIVRAEHDRIDSAMAVAYLIGQATVIRCDPALAGDLAGIASDSVSTSSESFEAWAIKRGWEFIDGNDQHVVAPEVLQPRPLPIGATRCELDRDNAEHRALLGALFERNDPEDVDEAEFELDDLDPHIVGLLDGDGELRAVASGRVWDADPDFDDIGVLTDEPVRGQGWGAAVVSDFCEASFARGRLPLYRCNWSRTASKALALSLGFEANMRLSAVGLPD